MARQAISFDALPAEVRNKIYDNVIDNTNTEFDAYIFHDSIAHISHNIRQEYLSRRVNDRLLKPEVYGKGAVIKLRPRICIYYASDKETRREELGSEWLRVHGKSVILPTKQAIPIKLRAYNKSKDRGTCQYGSSSTRQAGVVIQHQARDRVTISDASW